MQEKIAVYGLAHITGGGVSEICRAFCPPDWWQGVDTANWPRPEIFDWLASAGNVSREEMFRTFNCGLGMIVCVAAGDLDSALELLREAGEEAFPVGEVCAGDGRETAVELV